MPKPYLYDSAGVESQEAYFEIEPIANVVSGMNGIESTTDVVSNMNGSEAETEYLITVKADAAFINNEERVFPVTIDPEIKKFRAYKDYSSLGNFRCVKDANAPTKDDSLYVGRYKVVTGSGKKAKTAYYRYRAYMKLNLPDLKPGDIIEKAVFYSKISGEDTSKILCYRSEGDFTNATFDQQPCNKDTGRIVDYESSGKAAFDITKPVREWVKNPSKNFGLCFLAEKEDTTTLVRTIEPYQDSETPYLKITYNNFDGIENYWSTHKQSAGSAGTGYINDYTGNLTFIHEDASSVGERMTANVQHVYNNNAQKRVDQDKTECGNKWKLNYEQTLRVPVGEADIDKFPYVYTDADGTQHYFKKVDQVTYYKNGEKVIAVGNAKYPSAVDVDGLGLRAVSSNVVGEDGKKYPVKLVDESGRTSLYFDTMGRLSMVSDSNQSENGRNKDKKEKNRILISYSAATQSTPSNDEKIETFKNNLINKCSSAKSAQFMSEVKNRYTEILELKKSHCYFRFNYQAAKDILAAESYLNAILVNENASVTAKNQKITDAIAVILEIYL